MSLFWKGASTKALQLMSHVGGQRLNTFSVRMKQRARMPLLPLPFNTMLESLVTVIRWKRTEEGEGTVKVSICRLHHCLHEKYQGIFKTTTRTNKIIWYKVNIQKLIAFLYTSSKQLEKWILKRVHSIQKQNIED